MTKKIFAMGVGAAVCLSTACTSKTADKAAQTSDEQGGKTLVLYYSQTGATKTVAQELQRQLGDADIAAIEAVDPYPADYDETIKRWRAELDSCTTPEIKPLAVDLDSYSTIFLGFPIWGGTYALPIATFVKDNKLAGKTVVTFATFGSGGIGSATRNLAEALPEAKVTQGYGVRNARLSHAPEELKRFLIEGGYIDGTIEPLPEYSQQTPVTDSEKSIFDAACSGYKFPLGIPETVGKRATPQGVDYKFVAHSKTPDGVEGMSTIYITVPTGGTPEFTLVER
jgi:flavodoxin